VIAGEAGAPVAAAMPAPYDQGSESEPCDARQRSCGGRGWPRGSCARLGASRSARPREGRAGIELDDYQPYVRVRVDGTGPFWFLLDTGSASDVVDTETARALGIRVGKPIEARGAGEGAIEGGVASDVALTVAGINLGPMDVEVLPVDRAITAVEGRRVDGLLGYPFLSRFVVELGYAARRVTVADPVIDRAARGRELPIEIVRGSILVSARLAPAGGRGAPGRFLLDIGWRSALTLTSPFVARERLFATAPRTVDAITGIGIGGVTRDALARLPGVALGGCVIENVVAGLSRATSGILSQGDFAGIIGAEILRRFTVTFDLPHRRVLLAPNADVAAPEEFDMSGLVLTVRAQHPGAFTVDGVVEPSAGAEAGVRAGDAIEGVDGRAATDLTLDDVRRLVREGARREHRVTLRRGGERLAVTVRLRPLT
jgi:hypothetical protein